MKLFVFFKKEKQEEHITNATFDETGYVCNVCGKFNPMSFKYCPYCGTERFSEPKINHVEIPKPKEQVYSPKDEITVYLGKLNLLHLADKQYQIYIQLENGTTEKVLLIGRQNSNDALKYLRDSGLLRADEQYYFLDWPSADPCIGPWHHHVSACVCELNSNSIYHVVRIKNDDMRMLYGCPNSKSITMHTVLDQVKVEIIDYES